MSLIDYTKYYSEIFESKDEFQNFIDSIRKKLPKTIKVLRSKVQQSELPKWSENNFFTIQKTKFGPNFDDIFVVDRNDKKFPLGKSISHLIGEFYIQESSASIPAHFIDIADGEIVLDMCSAPGGKTVQLLDQIASQNLNSVIIANDADRKRIEAIKTNLDRISIPNFVITNMDGSDFGDMLHESIDHILLDAPCSGEGTGYKSSSAIDRRKDSEIKKISNLQYKLLNSAVHACKVGGSIVYSTCTLNPLENEMNILKILSDFDGILELEDMNIESVETGLNICVYDANLTLQTGCEIGSDKFLDNLYDDNLDEFDIDDADGVTYFSDYKGPKNNTKAFCRCDGDVDVDLYKQTNWNCCADIDDDILQSQPKYTDDQDLNSQTCDANFTRSAFQNTKYNTANLKFQKKIGRSKNEISSKFIRCRPHLQHTGGFFVAKLRKIKPVAMGPHSPQKNLKNKKKPTNNSLSVFEKLSKADIAMISQNMNQVFGFEIPSDKFTFWKNGKDIHLMPRLSQDLIQKLGNLPYIHQLGCNIGKITNHDFIPNHNFALIFGHLVQKNYLTIDRISAQKFVENQDLNLSDISIETGKKLKNSFFMIKLEDKVIGLAKLVDGMLKNKFLKW